MIIPGGVGGFLILYTAVALNLPEIIRTQWTNFKTGLIKDKQLHLMLNVISSH